MKRKAFGYGFVLLVIIQLLSPWNLNFSSKEINIEKNIANATTRDTIKNENKEALLIITGIEDKKNISVSMLTTVDYKINKIDKIEFIRDEFNDIESNCPKNNLILVSNPSLSNPTHTRFAGLSLSNTQSKGYLKNDYVFNFETQAKDFNAKCVEDNNGMDAWGHYKFTYEIEDRQGNKIQATEETETKKSTEPIKDNITYQVPYITMVSGAGNNFDIQWGILDSLNADTVEDLDIEGKTKKTIDADRSSQQTKNLLIQNFLQDGKSYKVINHFQTTTIDSTSFLPREANTDKNSDGSYKSAGTYTLRTSYNNTGAKVEADFDPKKVSGTQSTFSPLNSSEKKNIKKVFSKANYTMEDYSVKNFSPAIKDGKTVLDIDISMIINTTESRNFEPWMDIDKDGKASDKDLPGDDWDNFTLDFGSPKIDKRLAKEGNGFYLLYSSENKNPTIDGSDVSEINLNEYIFGEKIASPIITDNKTGMVFGIEPISVEKNKRYYFRLYAKDHDTAFDDSGYTETTSFDIPNNITQKSRGAGLLDSGNTAGNTNDSWLPACSLGFVPGDEGSIPGCAIEVFYYLIFEPSSAFLAFAGTVLDKILVYSISPDAYKVGYIVDSWRFVRDLCNLFFIFMLIYLAFKVILGVGHGTKKLIVNTIIIATVINFSYPLTTVIIDISNITARQLYYNAFDQKDNSGKPVGLSSTAASGYNPQTMILDSVKSSGLDPNTNRGPIFIVLLVGVIFNIIAMLMFLKLALQFIYRILGLVFAIILSPIALFTFSLEGEQRKKLSMVGFDQWMNGLIQDCFKAPVFLFLILIMTLFIKNNPFKNSLSNNVNGLDWWMSVIIPFMLIMGFLFLIEKVTKSMSSSIAELTGGYLMKGLGAVAGVAMGGAALAGTGILGKAATKFAGSNMGQRILDNAAKGGKFAELQAKLLRKAQSGSYDLRQTALGNAVSKETGANFNLGASMIGLGTGAMVGGYMGQVERRNKKRDEFVQMLEWNKNLAQEVLDKKNATEEEKKKKEDEAKTLKDQVEARERDFKNSEEAKKKADDDYSDIEKLEDLLAKRNDATQTGKPVNEIDVQIGRIEAKLGATAGSLYNRNTDPATGTETVSRNAAFNILKNGIKANKDNAKDEKDQDKLRLDIAKNNLKTNEKAIRQLDKDINELTKAIENIKKNRKNMYAHKIRNKSGHVFNKYNYGERKEVDNHGHAHKRNITPEEMTEMNRIYGNDLAQKMQDITTSVDEHSHTASSNQLKKLSAINASIGALAGAFTGGAGLVAGAAIGGLIGAIRSVSPGNEHYGVPHDKDEWHPHSSDGYKVPSGGGAKSGGGDAHAHDDHH